LEKIKANIVFKMEEIVVKKKKLIEFNKIEMGIEIYIHIPRLHFVQCQDINHLEFVEILNVKSCLGSMNHLDKTPC
jgi:hypothetical protein